MDHAVAAEVAVASVQASVRATVEAAVVEAAAEAVAGDFLFSVGSSDTCPGGPAPPQAWRNHITKDAASDPMRSNFEISTLF